MLPRSFVEMLCRDLVSRSFVEIVCGDRLPKSVVKMNCRKCLPRYGVEIFCRNQLPRQRYFANISPYVSRGVGGEGWGTKFPSRSCYKICVISGGVLVIASSVLFPVNRYNGLRSRTFLLSTGLGQPRSRFVVQWCPCMSCEDFHRPHSRRDRFLRPLEHICRDLWCLWNLFEESSEISALFLQRSVRSLWSFGGILEASEIFL